MAQGDDPELICAYQRRSLALGDSHAIWQPISISFVVETKLCHGDKHESSGGIRLVAACKLMGIA